MQIPFVVAIYWYNVFQLIILEFITKFKGTWEFLSKFYQQKNKALISPPNRLYNFNIETRENYKIST